jgi:hypothetical protein
MKVSIAVIKLILRTNKVLADCGFYSYRHSYIMRELQKPTVNLLALAQTVGKSSKTLHQYISYLGDVDLV